MGPKTTENSSQGQIILINAKSRGSRRMLTDNLPRPNVLLADRGFDADKTRDHLKARNLLPE